MANEKALTFSKNAKTLADTSHKGNNALSVPGSRA